MPRLAPLTARVYPGTLLRDFTPTPHIRPHTSEPFYTTKEPGKGSGLGLSMVHGFVTQSNGTVVIETELGTGSKVKLYLPEITDDKNTRCG